MRTAGLLTLAAVADSMPAHRFIADQWVEGSFSKPGPLTKLPSKARTDIVGALPQRADDWTWYVIPDSQTLNLVCVPVWAGSSLWDADPAPWWRKRSTEDRLLFGVWGQVCEWLETSNLGLVEALLGPEADGVRDADHVAVAARLREVAQMPEEVLSDCPRRFDAATDWLRGLGV